MYMILKINYYIKNFDSLLRKTLYYEKICVLIKIVRKILVLYLILYILHITMINFSL